MNIELSLDKTNGSISFCETDSPIGEYHGELFDMYVCGDRLKALHKWACMCTQARKRLTETECDGILKIDKLFS